MIPKRMYFFWNGPSLSWMRYMTLYSFRKMNPDWEIILCLSENNFKTKCWHTGEVQDFFSYTGISYFEKIKELSIKIEPASFPKNFKVNIKSPVHESDLYRYYKLHKDGGFYSDMDVLYFRSMNDFYNELLQSNIDTVIYQCVHYAAIGFLGAAKDNPFYKDLFYYAANSSTVSGYQSFGVDLIYSFCGIDRFSSNLIMGILKSRYKDLNIYNIPDYLVYQYDCDCINVPFNNALGIKDFNNNAIGYHWYAGSTMAQKYNAILNETNYMNYKITFSSIIKEVFNV